MANESKGDEKLSGKRDQMIKIDKLLSDKKSNKNQRLKNKLLALPSGKQNGKLISKKKKSKAIKGNKRIKNNVTFLFDELNREVDSFESLYSDTLESIDSPIISSLTSSDDSSDSKSDCEALRLSETTKFELNEIYDAIDNINKLCLDPIKVKIKKDYVKSKQSGEKSTKQDDLRYSADINIVLSNRKDEEEDTTKIPITDGGKNLNDFSLTIETISDSSKSEPCFGTIRCYGDNDFNKQTSNNTDDSVRTLENIISPQNTSEMSMNSSMKQNQFITDQCSSEDNLDTSSHNGPSTNNSRDINHEPDYKPYYGRTLFYRFHDPPLNCFFPNDCSNVQPLMVRDPNCLSPNQLGFDSVQSFNNSLNAMNEIIIKPPVTLGRTISFKSNMCKSVLSSEKFITNSVFQINWLDKRSRRKKRSFFAC